MMMCVRTVYHQPKPQLSVACFSCVELTVITFRYFQKKWVRQMLLIQNRTGYWSLIKFSSQHSGNFSQTDFHYSNVHVVDSYNLVQ